jgi:hypothetical protein
MTKKEKLIEKLLTKPKDFTFKRYRHYCTDWVLKKDKVEKQVVQESFFIIVAV